MLPSCLYLRAFIPAYFLGLGASVVFGADPLVETQSAEKTQIRKSLELLQNSAESYTKKRQCFSCHHQALTAMTMALAKRLGYPVDSKRAAVQSEFTLAYFKPRIGRLNKGSGVPGGPYTAGYTLVSLNADDRKPDDTIAALVRYLQLSQNKDGSWRIRTHRPPLEDSHFTATALSLRGLQLYQPNDQADEVAQQIRRAAKWLAETAPKTNEDRTFRLYGLKWSSAGIAKIKKGVGGLLSKQQDDGGWAQTADMDSDAYATGLTLVALHQAGDLPVSHAAYRRGVRFLLATRRMDGSWHVKTRSKAIQTFFESGFPHGKSQFISIAATGWATMAVMLAQPDTTP